jgi:hypothetical protein
MTKLAIAEYGDRLTIACIGLTTEHPDSVRFAADCAAWFGRPITYLHSDRYADTWQVWEDRRYLVGTSGAPCTGELKRKVRYDWQHPDDLHLFGYCAGEEHRLDRMREADPGLDLAAPLIDAGLDKASCLGLIERAGIELPAMYRLGYENNNCIGCVKGGMGYWNAIRVDFPDVFDRMAKLEREVGHAVCSEEIPGPTRTKRSVWLDELDPDRGDFNRDQPANCSLLCEVPEVAVALFGGAA